MRHQNKVKKLGRTSAHRKATLSALSTALIAHKRIRTTHVKAKALRTYVEPLLTKAKDDTTNNRRQVFRHLQDKEAIKTLFDEIAAKIADRPGGYTRIVKLGQRPGDGTEMAVIELVDYNTTGDEAAKGGKKRIRRTRRSTGKTATPKEAGDAAEKPAKAPKAPKAETPAPAAVQTPEAAGDTETPEQTSEVSAQAPGTPLDAPEATAGGDASNPESGIGTASGQNDANR